MCIRDRAVGDLPPQCASLSRSNVAVQEMATMAITTLDRESAFHAIALDPLTSSRLSLGKIREMFDEMWTANADYLKQFS